MNLTYDSIAEIYHRLAVPLVFLRPAKDILAVLRLEPDAQILDVGAGAGAAAQAIESIKGFKGKLVELDISLEMLKASNSSSSVSKVVGQVPGLPFCDNSFDAVISNFVLSHVLKYREAITDMVRVLKPGGKIVITSWDNDKNNYSELWNETAESVIGKVRLSKVVSEFMPSRDIFTNPENTSEMLKEAGVKDIEIHKSESTVKTTISDFIEMKSVMLQGRYIRSKLGAERFKEFYRRIVECFNEQFNDPVEYPRFAHIVIGTKP